MTPPLLWRGRGGVNELHRFRLSRLLYFRGPLYDQLIDRDVGVELASLRQVLPYALGPSPRAVMSSTTGAVRPAFRSAAASMSSMRLK
jgi:hypothetical protein